MVGRVVRTAVESPKRTTIVILYVLVAALCAFGFLAGL